MGELILMQLVELIENEFLYSKKELSVNSIIKDDFQFDEIDESDENFEDDEFEDDDELDMPDEYGDGIDNFEDLDDMGGDF